MTFVYRTPKQQFIKPVHELGPGSYDLIPKADPKIVYNSKSSVFGSSSPRDPFEIKRHQKTTEMKSKPKPKLNQSDQSQPSTMVQDASSLFKPKKSTDCSHVFNSKVQRFTEPKIRTHEQINQVLLAQALKKLLVKDINAKVKGKLLKAKDKLQKQTKIDQNCQNFPSIPNWHNSHGYRFDAETSKWVSNQNPNLVQIMLQKNKLNQKVNQALGPGCYVHNPNKQKSKNKHPLNQPQKLTDLGTFTCPNLKPETPIHNSIEEIQHKKKLRIRLLGQSSISKAQQVLANYQNPLIGQDLNLEGKNNKQVLLLNQMYKKFKNYIPRNQQKSPSKFFSTIQQQKQTNQIKASEPLKLNDVSNTHQHFLARSQRFNFDNKQIKKQKTSTQSNHQAPDQTVSTTLEDHSGLIHKSHNCKEPYSLGEDRFKQAKTKENLGPGTYDHDNMQNSKLPPCLNLKEERFNQKKIKSQIPGPGEYNVSQELLKKQNYLSDAFSYYKNIKNEEIRRHFKREDSMEALYQAWGRQMNYMVKMDNQSRPQNDENNGVKPQENVTDEKSLTQARKQLQVSLKKFNTTSVNSQTKQENAFTNKWIASRVEARSVSESAEPKGPSKIYPKVTKHLYEYKELPQKDECQNVGPGRYQTQKDMVKKTFNVTYT